MWAFEGSGRGPERWEGVESVRRGGAAVAVVEEWSCTPTLDVEKSMLGRDLPDGDVRIGVVLLVREGVGNDISVSCRSCCD